MYLSLNWLKDFVDIPQSIDPEELGLKLTTHTVEIDGIKKQAEKLDGVVVGEILDIKKHPNADKLTIAQVDVGETKPRQIIFGQMLKIEIGQKMPVALAPTTLPDNKKIEKTELRGEISEGMLCLDQELGLSKQGISAHFFDKSVKNGTSIIKALGLDDVIFEVDNKSITNRPDLWSHYGMAREISAFLNIKFKRLKNTIPPTPLYQGGNTIPPTPLYQGGNTIPPTPLYQGGNTIPPTPLYQGGNLTPLSALSGRRSKIKVKVEDFKLCPRYMAIVLDGIKIENSPEWMRKRLLAAGMRPINNIVDITNYVMLELGQPTHIFDLKKIENAISNFHPCSVSQNRRGTIFKQIPNPKSQINIIIRKAKNGEIIKTLDGQDQKLDDSMLVIADTEKPIAIAGIIGGANSEVDEKTSSILIESANFNPVSIRKTAQKLGLRSEASTRFEKSLDPNLCEIAFARIVELIEEFCPQAKIISELSDEKKYFLNQGLIKLNLEWVEKRIGKKIEKKKIVEILENLGFEINKDIERPIGRLASNAISVAIPSWRAKDVSISEDLIEEIVRIYGYDNLNPEMPKIAMEAPEINNERLLERKIKNILSIGAKLTEVYNYSFIGEKRLKNTIPPTPLYQGGNTIPPTPLYQGGNTIPPSLLYQGGNTIPPSLPYQGGNTIPPSLPYQG
ncbi:hypothetical protein KKE25_00620, partial [Patescibacteria group bacterium]|nr:hypothetical protein [Patescibacteria group bacterium]